MFFAGGKQDIKHVAAAKRKHVMSNQQKGKESVRQIVHIECKPSQCAMLQVKACTVLETIHAGAFKVTQTRLNLLFHNWMPAFCFPFYI